MDVKTGDKISQNPKTINEFVNALGSLLEKTHIVRSRLCAIAENLSAGLGDSNSTPMPEVGLGQLYAMEDRVNNQIDELNRIDQILTKLEQVIC